ncbi:MAG: hypothetical protein WCS56_00730 [Bacilli bacterium]
MLKKWWILFLLGLCTALPLYATVTEDYEAVLLEADGAIVDFAFGFKVFADTDIVVALVDEDSVGTVQTITTDYTVALNTTSDGGTVTFSEAPDEDYDVSITRAMPLTQATNIPNLGLFKAKHLENALDKLTLVVQDQGAALDRAVLQNPYGDALEITLPAASSGAFLGWNADADALENKTEPSSLPAATDEAILYGSGTAWAKGSVDGTTVELASGVLGIKDGGVDTTQLAADAVDGTKIADDAVDGDKVANDLLNDFTLKETPVLADSVAIVDSEASNVNKKATLTTIRTTMGLPTQAYSWFDDAANTVTKNLIAIDQDAFFIVEISVGHHDGAVISNNHAYKKYAVWTSSYLTGNAAIEEVDSKVAGAGSIALAVDGSYVKATINNGEFNTTGSIYVKGYNGTIESF